MTTPPADDGLALLNVADLCQLLRISRSTVDRMVTREGVL
jgi:predicted DNA-binding transcriptional regulator AlpA